ncbi:MAG: M20/M25/M40 family metallo-hydrolase [Saprospiraceae bacterium]|nr:M20/M25/M40 family metallo-hydrolase [Saprospiraceae bacterium]
MYRLFLVLQIEDNILSIVSISKYSSYLIKIIQENIMIENLLKLMEIDSTSGMEAGLAFFIRDNFRNDNNTIELQDVGDGTYNVFIRWGIPKVIFCTHLDTVPPYISPKFEGDIIYGRGACDAKGQIASMFEACLELKKEGNSGFGLLLLSGEEVGSKGANIANKLIEGCEYVIVGEPTENKIIRAGKGTKRFEVLISGKSAHSGYPHLGDDAVERFRKFLNELADIDFPHDEKLGETTYNISGINAPNAVNVVRTMFFSGFISGLHLIQTGLLQTN